MFDCLLINHYGVIFAIRLIVTITLIHYISIRSTMKYAVQIILFVLTFLFLGNAHAAAIAYYEYDIEVSLDIYKDGALTPADIYAWDVDGPDAECEMPNDFDPYPDSYKCDGNSFLDENTFNSYGWASHYDFPGTLGPGEGIIETWTTVAISNWLEGNLVVSIDMDYMGMAAISDLPAGESASAGGGGNFWIDDEDPNTSDFEWSGVDSVTAGDNGLLIQEVAGSINETYFLFGAPDPSIDYIFFTWTSGVDAEAIGFNANTPYSVPEPSTLLLMATGLAGLGFASRKKKQA